MSTCSTEAINARGSSALGVVILAAVHFSDLSARFSASNSTSVSEICCCRENHACRFLRYLLAMQFIRSHPAYSKYRDRHNRQLLGRGRERKCNAKLARLPASKLRFGLMIVNKSCLFSLLEMSRRMFESISQRTAVSSIQLHYPLQATVGASESLCRLSYFTIMTQDICLVRSSCYK